MVNKDSIQLSKLSNNNDPKTIMKEIKFIFKEYYSENGFKKIKNCKKFVDALFTGKYKNYKACNTEYHNLEHTEEAFLATARLIDGFNLTYPNDKISEEMAVLTFKATLFHDCGYIQEKSDPEGTGAKFTSCHVERSIDFVKTHTKEIGLNEEETKIVSELITATDMGEKPELISYTRDSEKYPAFIIATADLIGQMSNRRYLEKLLFLYNEFREAHIFVYTSEFDILKRTSEFYELVKVRLSKSMDSIYNVLDKYFKVRHDIDFNLYIEAIDRNISYVGRMIEDESTNFRSKLKRADWVKDFEPLDVSH